jgi:outer membrane lipoprotein SlyB
MIKIIKFLILPIILSLSLFSCNTTSPNIVKKSDAQKVTNIEYGTIKAALPVKIEGESDWVGPTAGAMIGGLLATQICGEEEVLGTKCQDIALVFSTIGGAALGSVIQAKLGNHDGFQYIVNIDKCGNDITNCQNDQEKAFVQGDDIALPNGQRVVIIYGDVIRVMAYEE